jgi:hypothetical protein
MHTTSVHSQAELESQSHYDGHVVVYCEIRLPLMDLIAAGRVEFKARAALRAIEAGESIEAGGFILSLSFEIVCKWLATRTLPFWRAFWAAMPPLAAWREHILDQDTCWDQFRETPSTEEAKDIIAWNGWHPVLKAQLEMFFGLRKNVPGNELLAVSPSNPAANS